MELLKVGSLYAESECRVPPFDPDKSKVLTSSVPVKKIEDCAPPEVSRALHDPDRFIRRSDEEVEAMTSDTPPIKVYWDAVLLQDRPARLWFIRALVDRRLVSYRRHIRSRVGVFFVQKKHEQIWMVIVPYALCPLPLRCPLWGLVHCPVCEGAALDLRELLSVLLSGARRRLRRGVP